MNVIKATKPKAVRSTQALILLYVVALGVIAMAVAQMVSFEGFVQAIRSYQVAGLRGSIALSVLLITLEVFSVPFLLRLWLSPAARFVSALFVLAAPVLWTVLTVSVLVRGVDAPNYGYYGSFVPGPVSLTVLVKDLVWLLAAAITFVVLGGMQALRLKRHAAAD